MIERRAFAALGAHDLDWLSARLLGAVLRAGDAIGHRLAPGRAAYLVSTLGRMRVNGVLLEARDGAAIRGETVLAISALDDTEVVLAELASSE
jgi:redox-sensitive bicupin YhaK (pirin superfamily)